MKICKYCKSEINKEAKVCPVCHKTLNFSIGRVLIGLLLVFFGVPLLYNIFTSNYVNNNSNTNQNTPQYITLDEFNKIENGMTYEEVKNIIGSEGTVMSQSTIGEFEDIIYYWYGSDEISNANFNFENNKLINKTQIGLK